MKRALSLVILLSLAFTPMPTLAGDHGPISYRRPDRSSLHPTRPYRRPDRSSLHSSIDAPPGTIRGQVVNGTAGGGSTAGLEVVLRAFQGASESETRTATTDAGGQFRFQNLQVGGDWTYRVQVAYQGVTYSQGMLSFETGQDEIVTEIAVYETTTTWDDQIEVGRAHVFITLSDASLLVMELYILANPTDRTYVGTQEIGGRRWASRFYLPQGSYDLAFDDGSLGGRFMAAEGGFVDTEPLWPGSTSVLYSYRLDCQASDCDLTREIAHPIADLNVLVPDSGVQVRSEWLAFEGEREAGGQPYLNYVGRDLAPGTTLDLHVRLSQAIPAPSPAPPGDAQGLPWIVLGGLVTLLVLAYPFWRQRVQATTEEKA